MPRKVDRQGAGAEPKSTVRDEPLEPKETQGENIPRRVVSIVSFRCRLLDPDNLCPKYFIDALRHAKVIEDDTPDKVEIVMRQEKVTRRSEERTEIEGE